MPAARGLGANALGDISPRAPRTPKELACQVGVGWVPISQLGAALRPLPSLTPALLSPAAGPGWLCPQHGHLGHLAWNSCAL